MVIFKKNLRQNLIKIYTKKHQIAPFKKIFSGGHAPNPSSKAHGFAMRSMSLNRDMQISKPEKKFLPPPLPNPGDAPELCSIHANNIS